MKDHQSGPYGGAFDRRQAPVLYPEACSPLVKTQVSTVAWDKSLLRVTTAMQGGATFTRFVRNFVSSGPLG